MSQNQLLAEAPGQQQVLDEERRRHEAGAVVHPAGRPELAHAGVDERVAGAGRAARRRARPASSRQGKRCEALAQRTLGRVREVVQQVVAELAPAELAQEGAGGAAAGPAPAPRPAPAGATAASSLQAGLGEAPATAVPHLPRR